MKVISLATTAKETFVKSCLADHATLIFASTVLEDDSNHSKVFLKTDHMSSYQDNIK